MDSRAEIIRELIEECGVLKYGEYVLKSGEKSEYYIDLKSLVSYPSVTYRIMSNISVKLLQDIEKIDKSEYILCVGRAIYNNSIPEKVIEKLCNIY